MDFRTRDQWGAEYDVSGRAMMTGLPVGLSFIHHTVTNPSDDPGADMRAIERIDIARFGVPSYSYVIHPTGVVLEGMGLHRGAHTINNANHSFNNDAFGVSFIGNFQSDTPTTEAFNACVDLLRTLVAQGHLLGDFTLSGHRDVFATACPGENLYPLIGSIRESVDSPNHAPTPPEDDMFTDDDQKHLNTVTETVNNTQSAVGRIEVMVYALAHQTGGAGTSDAGLIAAIQALPAATVAAIKAAL